MSTEIESNLKEHTLVEYFGGKDRGVCLQVTALHSKDKDNGHITLDITEAAELAYQLAQYCQREAMRRQKVLQKRIADLKAFEKTIFSEVAGIGIAEYEVNKMLVGMVAAVAPIIEEN